MNTMKKYLLLLALGAIGFQSCDKEDDTIYVPAAVETAFAAKYPDAGYREWEVKGGYYVADFHARQLESSAWFTPDGSWQMTESDLPYTALPEAVKKAFATSEFSGWKMEDVDLLERLNRETLYVLEVERGEQEYDLYYTEEGILVKSIPDSGDDSAGYLPTPLPEAVKQWIAEKYPQSVIADVEVEHGMTEVEILHEHRCKELHFDAAQQWIYTSWEVLPLELPTAVTTAIAQKYPAHRIDDAEFIESPAREFYLVELEQGEAEIKVKITAQGEFIL